MLNYKNIASVSVILLNYVEVTGIRVLHVKGDTECFNWWQLIAAVFFFTWILFFPFITEIILCNVYKKRNYISEIYHLSDDSNCFSGLQNYQ